MKDRRAFEAAHEMELREESGHIRRKLQVCLGMWGLESGGGVAGYRAGPRLYTTHPPVNQFGILVTSFGWHVVCFFFLHFTVFSSVNVVPIGESNCTHKKKTLQEMQLGDRLSEK